MARPFVDNLAWPRVSKKAGKWLVDTGDSRVSVRIRKKFSIEKEARAFADSFRRPAAPTALTPTQHAETALSLQLLKDAGFAGTSIVTCVRYWLRFREVAGVAPTVEDVYKLMVGERTGRYREQLEWTLAPFLAEFGKLKPGEIMPDALYEYLYRRRDIAETTRQNHYRAVQTLLSYCRDHNWLGDQWPLQKRHIPKVSRYNPKILTVRQARALKAASPPEMVPFMALALFCGIRTQELCRMKFSDIAYNNHDKCFMALVSAEVGKGNRSRNIPIPANAELWIGTYDRHPARKRGRKNNRRRNYQNRGRRDYIMPGLEGGVYARVRVIARKAGVPMSQNIMRHSFASYYYEVTRDAEQTRYRMGHETESMLFTHYRQLIVRAGEVDPFEYFKILPPKATWLHYLSQATGGPGIHIAKVRDIDRPTPEALRILHLL